MPTIDVARLRRATWDEFAVDFAYEDAKAAKTRRRVWPLGIVYLEASSVLLAWCHLRQDYRSFRLDRMTDLKVLNESFRPRRVTMLRDHIQRLRNETPIERNA